MFFSLTSTLFNTMIVDGKKIAGQVYERIRARVSTLGHSPKLTVITCNPNFETKKYLALKEKKAREVGITAEIIELSNASTTDDFLSSIHNALPDADAVIVQLPLPPHVDRDAVINAVPPTHDVDALNVETKKILSPVVGAIQEILGTHEITAFEKFVTIIGSGKLVGLPAYTWFTEQGAYVSMVTKDTEDISAYTKNADIIVCGAGVPNLLKPEMVKEGVIVLDAGTSEDGGELRGDADPVCAEKSSFFTPVPGGIGPITIARLLQNVVDCAERK